MNDPGEPTERQKIDSQIDYLAWCYYNGLDPDDQQTAREYEQWWEDRHPPGEEDRW